MQPFIWCRRFHQYQKLTDQPLLSDNKDSIERFSILVLAYLFFYISIFLTPLWRYKGGRMCPLSQSPCRTDAGSRRLCSPIVPWMPLQGPWSSADIQRETGRDVPIKELHFVFFFLFSFSFLFLKRAMSAGFKRRHFLSVVVLIVNWHLWA